MNPKTEIQSPRAAGARRRDPATRVIHTGFEPDGLTGAVAPPVYQTSTYAQEGLGGHKGYEYARTHNPTRERLERAVADLEGAAHGLAFGSGMAAIGALLHLFGKGDHVVASDDMYGGTYRLMQLVLADYGLEFSFVDSSQPEAVREALRPETRLIFVETPSNPLMRLTDLAAIGRLGRERGVLTAVDNTFCTPIFQRPLEHGIDFVVHSTTKYLNGHSDVVGGVLVTSREEEAKRLRFLQNAVGGVPGPWDCWLALRGLKTLALRMERHDANGRALAEWLSQRPEIEKLYYPGLASHPQHELAGRQMSGFGGMISFDLGSLERARRFCGALELFTLAESLGAVESLACHPATMTHASVPAEMRRATGLTDGLVRLSVGCEALGDLRTDLEGAFAAL